MSEEPQVITPLRNPFVDERGEIQNLLDIPCSSMAIIRSKKGALRANHYHKTDWHYCYLETGKVAYYHRKHGDENPPKEWIIEAGQMFYSPPLYEHAMKFLEESVMYVMAKNSREMANYESDTVRVELIDPRYQKIEG